MKDRKKVLITLFILLLLIVGCVEKSPVDVVVPVEPDPDKKGPEGPIDMPEKPIDPVFEIAGIIPGIREDQLGYPIVAHQDQRGNTYVLDLYSTNGIIKVFDPQGNFKEKFIPLPSPRAQVVDFALDGRGHIYIADLDLGIVQKHRGNDLLAIYGPLEDLYPRSIAVDSKDNLWVVSFDRIYKFSADGKSSYFGKSGRGDGEFGTAGSEFYIGPSGISIDENDHIYVADTLNNRIQKFDSDGRFLAKFPLGEDIRPQGIWVSQAGVIYVATDQNLIKLNSQGDVEKTLDFSERGARAPDYFNIGGGGPDLLLVAIPERHRVKIYADDREVYSLKGDTRKGFIYPQDIGIHDSNIALVAGDPFYDDEMNHRVMLFDKEGNLLHQLITEFGPGSFLSPKSIASHDDRWYVLDFDIISVFDNKGRFLTGFGGMGRDPGDFGVFDGFGQREGPFDIIFDDRGKLIISDTYNDRIQILDETGSYLGGFPAQYPGAIDRDNKGNIYIVKPRSGKVAKYTATGEKLLEFGGPGTGDGKFTRFNLEDMTLGPRGIAVDPEDGFIYVSDTQAHRIQVFDPQGNYIATLGGFDEPSDKRLFHPGGLAFDDEGYLWVADTGNHRIIKWRKTY